jgi:hypothetical protein
VFAQVRIVFAQGDRLTAHGRTCVPQRFTRHTHFLQRLLEQRGHTGKGFLAFVTIQRRSGFALQGGTLLVGDS